MTAMNKTDHDHKMSPSRINESSGNGDPRTEAGATCSHRLGIRPRATPTATTRTARHSSEEMSRRRESCSSAPTHFSLPNRRAKPTPLWYTSPPVPPLKTEQMHPPYSPPEANPTLTPPRRLRRLPPCSSLMAQSFTQQPRQHIKPQIPSLPTAHTPFFHGHDQYPVHLLGPSEDPAASLVAPVSYPPFPVFDPHYTLGQPHPTMYNNSYSHHHSPPYEAMPRPGPAPKGQPGYSNGASSSHSGFAPSSALGSTSGDRHETGLQRKDSGSKHVHPDDDDEPDGSGKRRRVQRACDVCRRKKIRCDGLQPDKNACTNCITYGQECKFEEAAKRRAPPRSYVEALEARMERVDKLLRDLAPGIDFTKRIGQPVRLPDDSKDKEGSPKASSAFVKPSPPRDPGQPAPSVLPHEPGERKAFISRLGGTDAPSPGLGSDGESTESYHDEEVAFVSTRTMARDNGNASIEVHFDHPDEEDGSASPCCERDFAPAGSTLHEGASFIGNSSNFHLIPALEKMNASKDSDGEVSLNGDSTNASECGSKFAQQTLRAPYWTTPKCLTANPFPEHDAHEKGIIDECWPEPDLEEKLVEAYFTGPHRSYPILNETVFRRDQADPARRQDNECKMIALSVFAVASRYIDDERVLDPSLKDDDVVNTRGAKWFNACRRMGYRLLWPSPTLAHIQSMVLAVIFINGTPLAHSLGWGLMGLVVRMLQSAGAHRRLTAARLRFAPHIEECWRRLWWTTYMLDREQATSFGRPMAVQDEDFDIEQPREIDDEYLARGRNKDGSTPQQPSDQPSFMSGFISSLKLDEILGRTLRTIYAIGKAKASRGIVGKGWDQLIVAEIDSALNHWLDEVPTHLRYNPDESNDAWLIQSTLLYSKYYYCQILVHRPFIAGPKTRSSLNFPSLAITTNAARSSVQMIWTLHQRGLLRAAGSSIIFRTFEASCVLLLVGWGSKKTGQKPSATSHNDIKRCIKIMQAMEKEWVLAGRLGDLVRMFSSAITGTKMDESVSTPDGESDASNGRQSNRGGPLVFSIHSGARSGRREKNRSNADSGRPLPLSTQDLGVTPVSESPTAPVSTAATPDGVGEGQDWPARQSRGDKNGSTTGPEGGGSVEFQQLFSNPFADLLPRSGSGGATGGELPFASPLDMPSFASALFGTSGTPGNFFGSQANPMLTPGAHNSFGGTGFTPAMDANNYMAAGRYDGAGQMPLQGQDSLAGGFMTSANKYDNTMPPPSAAVGQQQTQQQQQQQQQQGGGGNASTGDAFNDIFRDLWTAQEIFASDATAAANHFHF